jgi:hypothetical protein
MNKSVHETSIHAENVKRKSLDPKTNASAIPCGTLSHACKNACKCCNKSFIDFTNETKQSNHEFGRTRI